MADLLQLPRRGETIQSKQGKARKDPLTVHTVHGCTNRERGFILVFDRNQEGYLVVKDGDGWREVGQGEIENG